jgi:peptidyl-tRNA hydrolase, PTH1 family
MSTFQRWLDHLLGRTPGSLDPAPSPDHAEKDERDTEMALGPSTLIVGLGNPGLEYSATRHNVGFLCLDRLATKHRLRFTGKRARSALARGTINGHDVALAKPQTYMNLSGQAARELLRIYKLPPTALLVVYDDVDLPVGTIRLRERGGPGTHNGMRSLVDELDTTDFPRLRIGVGMPTNGQHLADYVLGLPTPEERTELDAAIDRAVEAIEILARRGIGAAMNACNTDRPHRTSDQTV